MRYDIPQGSTEAGARVLVDRCLEIDSINREAYRSYAGRRGGQRAFLFGAGDYVFRLRYVSKDRIFKTMTDFVVLDCTFQSGKYYEIYGYFRSADEISIGYQEIQPREKEILLFSK